jgi:hypothetical protein
MPRQHAPAALQPLTRNNSHPGPAIGVRELLASMRQHSTTPRTAPAAAENAGPMTPLVPNNSRPGPAVDASKLLAQMRRDVPAPRTAPVAAERFGVGSMAPMTTNNSRPGVARPLDVPVHRQAPRAVPAASAMASKTAHDDAGAGDAPRHDLLLALLRQALSGR